MSGQRGQLVETLGVGPGSVVCFVGAGGKTSLLFALATEAAERWGPRRVLVTTTTKMLEPAAEDFPDGASGTARGQAAIDASWKGKPAKQRLALVDNLKSAVQVVKARALGHLVVLGTRFVGEAEGRRKFAGVPPEWVDELTRCFPEMIILVEADGSARKPLKAPTAHEPVIPASATVVVAVAGVDALGVPLDADHVHRPERLSQLTGHAPRTPVTSDLIAAALWHEQGGGKGRPPGAVLVPVINKVDGPSQLDSAREVAAKFLNLGAARVPLTSCRHWPVVVETIGGEPSVAAIVLAAGASTRMGTPKQLLLWEGEPLVFHAVRAALAPRVGQVVVVLGHMAAEVRQALEPLAGEAASRLAFAVNRDYAEGGQSSSLKVGLAALRRQRAALTRKTTDLPVASDLGHLRGVVFVNCDQPLLRAAHIGAFLDRFEAARAPGSQPRADDIIIVPVHSGRQGHPILFGCGFLAELANVNGDMGGRAIVGLHRESVIQLSADEAVTLDVDTPEQYEALLRASQNSPKFDPF
ncbi:MAG: selenium cofactor biosynthesis protein YqeC [Bacillota bacterium]